MAEITIKVKGYRCNQCGNEWIPRSKELPSFCPKCRSLRWNKTKREIREK